MVKKIVVFGFLLIVGNLYSQNYNTKKYNYTNGLNASGIVSVAFESNCNKLWLSTRSDGIYSFDGKSFSNFKLPFNEIPMHSSQVVKTNKGEILQVVSTLNEVYFCKIGELKMDKFDTIKFFNPQFLNIINTCFYFKDDTTFMVQIFDSSIILYNLKNKKVKIIEFNKKINNFMISENRIFVSNNEGVEEYSLSFNKKTKVLNEFSKGFVFSSFFKQYYNISKEGISIYSSNFKLIKKINLSFNQTKKNLSSKILFNYLYVFNSDLTYRLNLKNVVLEVLNESVGLIEAGSNDIQGDLEGNTWFCQRSGLVKMPFLSFKFMSGKSMGFVNNEISAIKIKKDIQLVSSGTQIIDLKNKQKQVIQICPNNKNPNSRILDIEYFKEAIVIPFFNGITKIQNFKIKAINESENSKFMSVLKINNRLFYSENNKLIEYLDNGKSKLLVDLKSNLIRKLNIKNNNEMVICGFNKAYLFQLSKGELTEFKIKNSIYNYCFDSISNKNYFACKDGLYVEKNEKVDVVYALKGIRTYAVEIDKGRHIWVGTNDGIYVLDTSYKLIYHFNVINGLVGNEINRGAFEIDEYGDIWAGTTEGINIIPTQLNLNTKLPELNLKYLKANDSLFSQKQTIFSYNQNDLEFTFEFPSFVNEENNKFSYYLLGYDKKWSKYNNQNVVSYKNLPPGSYKLHYKAKNSLDLETKVYTFDFEIYPPWWKSNLFYIFVICVSLLIFFLLFKWRLNVLNSRKKNKFLLSESELKALRSQINPHYLSNSLTSLQKLILRDNKLQAMEVLNKFGKVMRNILNNSENQFMPLLNEINTLREYMDLEALLHFDDSEFLIQYNTITQSDLEKIKIPSMLIQPFVENAIIHGLSKKISGVKKLTLTFTFNQKLVCIIEDNGIGRDLTKIKNKTSSKGNSNVEQRLKLYGELLKQDIGFKIVDLFDKKNNAIGTKIVLSLPYNYL